MNEVVLALSGSSGSSGRQFVCGACNRKSLALFNWPTRSDSVGWLRGGALPELFPVRAIGGFLRMGFLDRALRGLLRDPKGEGGDAGRGRTGRRRLRIDREIPLIYAIGDVHGCIDQLRELEALIARDARGCDGEKLIVMLGDYVDRGEYSSAVLDHLLDAPPVGFDRICLCGNHDDLMLSFVKSPMNGAGWLDHGGDQTLRSYGIDFDHLTKRGMDRRQLLETIQYSIPENHIRFLEALPVLLSTPGYVFVHAGIRPGVALSRQTENDLMWIREEFVEAHDTGCGTIVHGHTPYVEPLMAKGRIGIDTAAYMTGRLTALKIEQQQVSFITTAAGGA